MYASDTSNLNEQRNLDELKKVISENRNKIIQYFEGNILRINLNKTNVIPFKWGEKCCIRIKVNNQIRIS
jgi:hypothetical protein